MSTADGLQRIVYADGEPYLLLTAGTWHVWRRTHARAPWKREDVVTVPEGEERTVAYGCEDDNPLVRVRRA